jgi:nitroreductase
MWRKILGTAIHAPSPHNVQPWRVRILSDYEAELFIEKRRTLPKEDVTGSFIILTMGLFIEALDLLARNRSHKLEFKLYQEPSQFTPEVIERAENELLPFARLRLETSDRGPSPYSDEVFMKRRTSRISLLPRAVPEEAATSLSAISVKWKQRYEQIIDPEVIEEILACNTDALFEDLNSPDYHDEIVEWFRFTSRSSRRTRDGLDYRCMNSARIPFWLAARMPGLLQLSLARPVFAKIYRAQLGVIPTIGMLSGPFWKPEDAFESGRFLMHFWLELSRHDLYIHPYGNLVTNRRAADWCHRKTGIPDIWLIFKIGYSAEPPKSYRRSVEEVLID